MKWIIGGFLTIAILTGCSAADDPTEDEPTAEDYSCADLAEEAATIGENNLGVELLKVRDPQITKDNRSDYSVPSGADEVVILQCRGMGVFSTGDNSNVRIELTMDADEDAFVSWEALD